MKKYYAFMLAAAAAVVACNKENLENTSNNGNADVKYVDVTLSATIEGQDETKTSVNVEGNKATVSWSSNDQISVFDNAPETTNKHNNVFTWNGSEFNGTLPVDEKEVPYEAAYALYPYRTGATFDTEKGIIATTLFADQDAAEGTFADGFALMAGKITDGAINFKNLCSHVKFHLTEENVKSITLMGNKNEALCGTFNITWNGDEPQINITKPETYVTVRNSDGTALTADSNYYITTLPVEFTDGFTLILSYMDGSQKIKSLSSDVKLERRKISPLSTPASFDEGRVNYFVQYNDGFDVTVGELNNGGVTFSKTTNPGGVLVNATKGNTTITKDGIYFLGTDKATFDQNEINGIVFCGMDSQTKSPLEFNRTLQPATNTDGSLIFNNLELSPSATFTNDFISQKKVDANPGTEYGSMIFNNCKIKLYRHLIYIINKEISISKVSILDCDFFASNQATCIISFGGQMASTISELNVRNNIFSPASGKTITEFKILQGPEATVKNINVYSNTIANAIIPNGGCIIVKNVENCYIIYNLFNEIVGSKAANLGNYKGTEAFSGNVINNYYYTISTLNLNNALKPSTAGSKAGSPVRLETSPLSAEWNPENGVYGSYTITAKDSKNQPGEAIIGKIGAKRTGKASTTSTTANSADYRNAQVDLGTF